MAIETACTLRMGREQYAGKARLEAEHIDFSGGMKFRFRFSEIRNPARTDGNLTFNFHGHYVQLDLGGREEKWLESILHPKTLSEKLGVRPGHSVRLINVEDALLTAQLAERKARIVGKDKSVECDVIVFAVERPAELRQLTTLVDDLRPDGVIWVLLPKSSKTVTHANVAAAARQAGLSETQSISFSEAYSAHKIMIAPGKRRAARSGNGKAARETAARVATAGAAPGARRASRKSS